MPAKSIAQQRVMAQAYGVKKGDIDPKDLDPQYRDQIVDLADSMTLKQLKDFAETKHSEIKESRNVMLFEEFITRNEMNK